MAQQQAPQVLKISKYDPVAAINAFNARGDIAYVTASNTSAPKSSYHKLSGVRQMWSAKRLAKDPRAASIIYVVGAQTSKGPVYISGLSEVISAALSQAGYTIEDLKAVGAAAVTYGNYSTNDVFKRQVVDAEARSKQSNAIQKSTTAQERVGFVDNYDVFLNIARAYTSKPKRLTKESVKVVKNDSTGVKRAGGARNAPVEGKIGTLTAGKILDVTKMDIASGLGAVTKKMATGAKSSKFVSNPALRIEVDGNYADAAAKYTAAAQRISRVTGISYAAAIADVTARLAARTAQVPLANVNLGQPVSPRNLGPLQSTGFPAPAQTMGAFMGAQQLPGGFPNPGVVSSVYR